MSAMSMKRRPGVHSLLLERLPSPPLDAGEDGAAL